MTSGYHVLEVVASCHREMLGSVLSVWTHTLAGLKWPTQCSCVSLPKESNHVLVHVFLCRTRAAKIFKGFLLRLGNGCIHNLVHRTIQCAAPRRTLGFVLSVKPSRASVANTMRTCFFAKGELPRFSRVSRCIDWSSWKFGSTTKCATRYPSSNVCQTIDKAGRMRQAPTLLKIARGTEIRRIEDARACQNRQSQTLGLKIDGIQELSARMCQHVRLS